MSHIKCEKSQHRPGHTLVWLSQRVRKPSKIWLLLAIVFAKCEIDTFGRIVLIAVWLCNDHGGFKQAAWSRLVECKIFAVFWLHHPTVGFLPVRTATEVYGEAHSVNIENILKFKIWIYPELVKVLCDSSICVACRCGQEQHGKWRSSLRENTPEGIERFGFQTFQ